MSTHYNYYIGYRSNDNLIHMYGPFNKFGNLTPIFRTRNSTTGLDKEFLNVKKEEFDVNDWNKHFEGYGEVKILPVSKLPNDDFTESKFFHKDDIIYYINNKELYPEYESFSPVEYGIRVKNAIKNNDTDLLNELNKYELFTYEDRNSVAYEVSLINNYLNINFYIDRLVDKNTTASYEKLKELLVVLLIS